jgi:RHS repeat-associated protein
MDRAAIRGEYDAVIDLFPWNGVPRAAMFVVKVAYDVGAGGLTRSAAVPLAHDVRTLATRQLVPRGSDFVPYKRATDVVVLGSAFAPSANVPSFEVGVQVGALSKRARVFGRRFVRRAGGRAPILEATEPADRVPLTREEAYGGGALIGKRPSALANLASIAAGDPTIYPRNPYGKGYWTVEWDRDLELPRLEDPADPITLARILEQPNAPWPSLPLPWHFDWAGIDQFPRAALRTPELPVPAEVLAEVQRGLWRPEWVQKKNVEAFFTDVVPFQEASLGMAWAESPIGARVRIEGMHPSERVQSFALPDPPRMEIEIEGSREAVAPRLTQLVLIPHEERITMTWAAVRSSLPRKFVPGVHGHIPLRGYVEGDRPIEYETPAPIAQLLRHAESAGRVRRAPRASEALHLPSDGTLATETPIRDRDRTPASELVGDVDVPTGRTILRETDWVHDGASFAFPIRRGYASSQSWRAGALGPGWSHPLEQAVWTERDELYLRAEDGREIAIAHLPTGELGLGQSVHWAPEALTIARIASDAYELRRADGWRAQLAVTARSVRAGPVEATASRLISPFGLVANVMYDARGILARLVLPSGRELRFEHDARGRLIAVHVPVEGAHDAIGARYDYDGDGQLVRAMDGAGRVTTYRYQARLLVERVSAGGLVTRYRYDGATPHARTIASERTDRGRREIHYRSANRRAVVIDATGRARTIEVDDAHRITLRRDASGRESSYAYDEATGAIILAIDRGGQRTEFLYDSAGHLAEQALPGGGSVVLDYDEAGRLQSRTAPDGSAERWGWDRGGRLQSHTRPEGGTIVYEYAVTGGLACVVTSGEVRLTFERSADHRSIAVRTPFGERRLGLDPLGRISEITDEAGHRARLRYHPSGWLNEIQRASSSVSIDRGSRGVVERWTDGVIDVRWDRDADLEVTAVHAGGEEIAVLHRDAEHRVTLVQDPTFGMHELRYDARGSLIEESTSSGAKTSYVYDDEARLVGVRRTDVASRYERDHSGRVVRATHGLLEERFEWTAAGRLKAAITSAAQVYLHRDSGRRIVRETHAMGGQTVEIASTYDACGRRVAIESSLGARVRIQRDPGGAPIVVHVAAHGTELALEIRNDARGLEIERRLPGGVSLHNARDDAGRVAVRRIVYGSQVLAETRYSWSGVGRLTTIHDSVHGTSELAHDARGFLVRAGSILRAVDEVGNVYRVATRDDHRYGAGGRLLEAYGTAYAYDDDGRRIEKRTVDGSVTRYTWEGPGRLATVELPEARRIRYAYDALGRCVARTVERCDGGAWIEASRRRYVWDGLALLHEIDAADVATWSRVDGCLAGSIQHGRAYAMLTDVGDVVREVIDAGGGLVWRGGVDVFGAGWRDVQSVAQPWRWPGHIEDDETGLSMSLLRPYDPEAGQYLCPAPHGIASGVNLYAYLADPVSAVSPLGLGPGIDPWFGTELPPCGERLHVDLLIGALDRGDGAEGPRARFERVPLVPSIPELALGRWSRGIDVLP